MTANRRKYHEELLAIMDENKKTGRVPRVLLHSCCAPCSSYCIETLARGFYVTVFYYNPNIYPDEEYELRVREQERFIREFSEHMTHEPTIGEASASKKPSRQNSAYMTQQDIESDYPFGFHVDFIEGDFEKDRFYNEVARGLEDEPERGRRCEKCFDLRLSETAKRAAADGYDYFCTTLTISPQKDPVLLNTIGERLASEYGVPFLPSEFRKCDGYKRSTEISREFGMYRQDYCGCVYSYNERRNQKEYNDQT